MVMEGVFERFPRLRVAYLEAGAGWVPYNHDRLDRSYEIWSGKQVQEFSPWLKKAAERIHPLRPRLLQLRGRRGHPALRARAHRAHQAVLFASDFPHETNIERAKHEIEEAMHHEEVSDEPSRRSSIQNVVRFYGPRLVKQQAKERRAMG